MIFLMQLTQQLNCSWIEAISVYVSLSLSLSTVVATASRKQSNGNLFSNEAKDPVI